MTKTMPKPPRNSAKAVVLSPPGVRRELQCTNDAEAIDKKTLIPLPKHVPRLSTQLSQATVTLIPSDAEPTTREEDSPSSTNAVCSDSQESSRSQPLEQGPDLNRPQGLAEQTDRPSSGMSEAAAPRIPQTRSRQSETQGSSAMYSTISDTESELSSDWQTAQRRRTRKRQAKLRSSQLDAITPAATIQNVTPSGNTPLQHQVHNTERTPTPPTTNTYMTDVVNGVIPAIVINKGFQGNLAPLNREFTTKFTPHAMVCRLVRDGTAVHLSRRVDYNNLLKFFNEKRVPFHILADNGKTLKIVIRGVPSDLGETEVAEALKAEGYEPLMVNNIKGRNGHPYPMYLITLPDNVQNKSIYQLRGLCHYVVRVENQRGKPPVQCRNCQKFLHKSNECNAPPCCRLCAGEHPAWECGLTRNEPRCCANCYGEHPADSIVCSFRRAAINATEKQMRLQERNQPPIHTTNVNPRPHTPPIRNNQHQQTTQRTRTPPAQNTQQQQTTLTSPGPDYSTVVARASVHAPSAHTQNTQPNQNTRTTGVTETQEFARNELRRMQREIQQSEVRDLRREAMGTADRRKEPRSENAPHSPRRRRESGNRSHIDKELQTLKRQIQEQQRQLQAQHKKLLEQQNQLTQWQAQLKAEAERLREKEQQLENGLITQNPQFHQQESDRWHPRLGYRFSKRAGEAAKALRLANPEPIVPRLLDGFYEAHELLRRNPVMNTLPEAMMALLGHIVGAYEPQHTGQQHG